MLHFSSALRSDTFRVKNILITELPGDMFFIPPLKLWFGTKDHKKTQSMFWFSFNFLFVDAVKL